MRRLPQLQKPFMIGMMLALTAAPGVLAQDNSGNSSWTSSSQISGPSGTTNPTRTTQSHSESGGRVIDKTTTEATDSDGRYRPYQETEKESVRVNDTTTRTIERIYGRDADGRRTLLQERQEETRKLGDEAEKVTRTTSTPDADGRLQVSQRELVDSRQASPGVRDTKTTLFAADPGGALAPKVQTEERETKREGGTVEFKKSTSIVDLSGNWALSEVREGTTKQSGDGGAVKEENVLRPDANGRMSVIERTVTRNTDAGGGETRESVETYSNSVPGQALDDHLQLIQRQTTVHQSGPTGRLTTTRQVERPNPGVPGAGLRLTQEAIDIVRPGANGTAQQTSTVLTSDPDGRMNTVWVDMGKSDNPAAIHVETTGGTKPPTAKPK